MRDYTKDELLALVPDRYLEEGWFDAAGRPRRELLGEYATASGVQFQQTGLSPQELSLTFEAVRLLLPEHDEAQAGARLHATTAEALFTVARGIRQSNNEGLVRWLNACMARVQTPQEVDAFLAHMQAVTQHYAVAVALLPPDGGSAASPPASSA